jgi:hypothetical protein
MYHNRISAQWFRRLTIAVVACMLVAAGFGLDQRVEAACTALPTPNGSLTQSFSVPATATYTVWSRIMAPDSTANSYYLEVDDTTCGIVVGDSAITANNWAWVNYQGGNTNSKITMNLTAGTHTLRMVGRETGVKLDRVVFTADTACIPTGLGDNCASPPNDTSPPLVSITAPTSGQTVTGTVNVTTTATDNVGVTRVDFLVDSQLAQTDSTAPFALSWNTTSLTNGSHSVTARAYDADGNSSSASVTVTVSNGTTPPPPPPTFRAEDINQDGRVNLLDFSLLASKYGQTTNLGRSDINADGRVNLQDFSLLASKFGS